MEPEPINGLTDEELADLARLADGTLPVDRRAEVEARVAASPELARMVESQAVAVRALRGTADVGAPVRLRADIDRRRGAGRDARRARVPFGLRSAIATATAVVLALVVLLPGVLSGAPSVAEAADLAQRPANQPAPAVAAVPQLLRAEVDGVSFPNYAAKFGWKPTGVRHDSPSGRDATTVYYEKGGRTMAYTIVSGDALAWPSNAHSTTRGEKQYRVFRYNGRTVVTWKRGGHTCVLSSRAVAPAELVALADWRGKGAISS